MTSKLMRFALVVTLAVTVGGFALTAHAGPMGTVQDDITFMYTTGAACGGQPSCQAIMFSNMTIVDHGDKSNNASVSISGNFYFNQVSGGVGYFAPLAVSQNLSITGGGLGAGGLNGDINAIKITLGANDMFTITMNIIDATCKSGNCGGSALLSSIATTASGGTGDGTGTIKFTFSGSGLNNGTDVTSLSQLLGMTDCDSSGDCATNANGPMSAGGVVPEPLSMGLFGTGFLMAGAWMLRRKHGLNERR